MRRQSGELVVGIGRERCEQRSGAGRIRTGDAECGLCWLYFWWVVLQPRCLDDDRRARFAINDMGVK